MQNDNAFIASTAVDDGLHAKRTYTVDLPDEVASLLRSLACKISTASYDLMKVACTDIAARGRVVATLAEAKDLLDARLGIKKRKTTVLALNDLVFDVFIFLGRKELDMLQVVNRRFNDVIDSKMTLVCLRHLACAEIVPSVEEQQFLLGFEESGSKKTTRFPTGVDNPDELRKAFSLLVHACRSAVVERLDLYYASIDSEVLDSIVRHGSTMFVDTLAIENWKLCVTEDSLLQALQSFAELKCVHVVTRGDSADIWGFLFRNCFKINSSYVGSGNNLVDGWWDADTAMNRLMEFSFGQCDERYAAKARNFRLRLKFLPPDFVKTWIQYAETVDCLHQLTLNVEYITEIQDLTELDAYERPNGGDLDEDIRWRRTFGSLSGRRWTAVLEENNYYHAWVHLNINV